MKTSIAVSCFFVIGILVPIHDIHAQTSHERILKEAESRLRAIYDRKEFRAKRFRADWLGDSSGYTVMESVADGNEQVLVRYDVPSGKRTVPDLPQKKDFGRSGKISPDGRSALYSEHGNLYVRDLSSDRKIPLTKSAALQKHHQSVSHTGTRCTILSW